MKHAWVPVRSSPADGTAFVQVRECSHCGARQKKEAQHTWMRVTGYRWYPLAGRCRGSK